jgi:hypothetical protein
MDPFAKSLKLIVLSWRGECLLGMFLPQNIKERLSYLESAILPLYVKLLSEVVRVV